MEEKTSLFFSVIREHSTTLPWVDQNFVEKIVRQHLNDAGAQIHSFEVHPGSNSEKEVRSLLYRCSLKYSSKHENDKKMSLFIKTMPESNDYYGRNTPVFDIEMRMYGETLPKIMEALSKIDNSYFLHPKLIYQSKFPRPVIILEDVNEEKFATANCPPTNYEESKICVKKLAQFHAASFYLANHEYADYTDYDFFMFKNMSPEVVNMFNDSFKMFIEEIKDWQEFEEHRSKLEALQSNFMEKGTEIYMPSKIGYNVLNHGDHHTKNIMCKKNVDGEIEEVIFIDFQRSVWGSPAIDLIYSLYYDLSIENREKYRDDFIAYYHSEFVQALKNFGYLQKPPSLLDLNSEILRNGFLEVIIIVCFNVMCFIDWAKITPEDFDMADGTKRFMKRCYQNPEYHEMLKRELQRLLLKGMI